MYERFTDRARKVMQLANQEAQRFNHDYIGTEHILLGLVKEGAGVAANVLKNLDVDLRKVRIEVEKIVQAGGDTGIGGKLPPTPKAKKVVEFAIEEANTLGHNYVGTEHLLLGLLREQEGVASQVLMNLGVELEVVREEVLNLLGHNPDASLSTFGTTLPRKPKEPDPELADVPPNIVAVLLELDKRLTELGRTKEEAVAAEDFEKAARLRDEADRLKKERDATFQAWKGKPAMRFWEFEVWVSRSRKDGSAVDAEFLGRLRQRLQGEFGHFVESSAHVMGTVQLGEQVFQGETLVLRFITRDAAQATLSFSRLREEFHQELETIHFAILSRKVEGL